MAKQQLQGSRWNAVGGSQAETLGRDQLLQLNDIGLRVALTGAAGTDIFFIPEVHFGGQTPEQDDEGWYQVRSFIWCRECRKCGVRKEQAEFERNEWLRSSFKT